MAREFTMGARINLDTNRYSSGMAQAIRATSNLDTSVDRLDRSMEQQESQMGRLRSAASGLTGVFAALGGAMAIKGAFNWLVEGNASMEQYQNTLATVLKSEEKAVETLAWANKFAAQTPFEIPQVVEATTVMAAYGMTAQENLGIIGDMASVMGKDLMQAVEAIADANTGELERLKEFGITKKMIEEQAKLMGKQVFDKKGSMKDQEAFNEVLFTMMEDRFEGGMARQATTFKGMLSNAQDYISTMGRTLGQPIFEKMKSGLGSVLEVADRLQENGTIDRWIANVHKGFSSLGYAVSFIRHDVIGAILEVFGDFVSKNKTNFTVIGGVIVEAFNRVKSIAGPVLDWLVMSAFPAVLRAMRDVGTFVLNLATTFIQNFSKFKPYIIGIATALITYKVALMAINAWTKIVAKAQLAWNAVMAMNPVILIVIAIGLLIGYLIHLAGGWDVVKAKLIVFWGVIVNAFKNIMAVVVPILQQLGTKLVSLWVTILPKIKMAITAIKTTLVNWAMGIWAVVGPFIMMLWNGIMTMFNAGKAFIDQWGGTIIAAFQIYWAFISSIFMSALTVIWTVVKGAFTYIYNIVSGIFKIIVGVIEVAWSLISGIFSVALNLLSGDWQGAWDAMLGMLGGVWTGIKTFFDGLKDLFFDSGKAIITTLVEGIKSVATAPAKAISGALGKVREFLPFSDAKTGPLSNLTMNGSKIVTTMAEGIYKQQGTLAKAMDSVLAPSVSGTANVAAGTADPAGRTSGGAGGGRAAVIIQKLVEAIHIHGAEGKDARVLVDEIIAELYERFEKADEILSAVGLGDLLK